MYINVLYCSIITKFIGKRDIKYCYFSIKILLLLLYYRQIAICIFYCLHAHFYNRNSKEYLNLKFSREHR